MAQQPTRCILWSDSARPLGVSPLRPFSALQQKLVGRGFAEEFGTELAARADAVQRRSLRLISALMGHLTTEITMNHYVHRLST